PFCLSCAPRAIQAIGRDLYVAGQFIAAGGIPANGLAKWDGASWTSLDFSTNSAPAALAIVGANSLYVGGPAELFSTSPYLMRGNLTSGPLLEINMTSNNGIVISWPSATNTVIQQVEDLSKTNWVSPSEKIYDNGVKETITVSPDA